MFMHTNQRNVTTRMPKGFNSSMLKIYKQSNSVRYEVFIAELLKIQSFWFVTPCLLLNSYRPFQRPQCLQKVWDHLPIVMVKHPRRPGSPMLILCFTQKLSCTSCPYDLFLEWQYNNNTKKKNASLDKNLNILAYNKTH